MTESLHKFQTCIRGSPRDKTLTEVEVYHETTGVGSPVAWQLNWTDPPSLICWNVGIAKTTGATETLAHIEKTNITSRKKKSVHYYRLKL